MSSPQGSQKFIANNKVTHYDFDPGATTLTDIAWVDMRDFEEITASFFRTVGTGAVVFHILANAESDGSGTDINIKTHAVGSEPDAVGDYLFLSCSAEEVAQEASDAGVANARYVTAQVSVATDSDEGVVTYIMSGANRPGLDLTADSVA